jgi:hypothetical protein
MRFDKIILTLLLIFICSKAFSNGEKITIDTITHAVKIHYKRHSNWPKIKYPAPSDKVYYQDCVFVHRYTAAQRLAKYPYNKAVKILAVSYDGTAEPNIDIVIGPDTVKHEKRKPHGLIFHNGVLDTTNLFEIKHLSATQINGFTNIMMNIKERIPNDYASVNSPYACFNPRNAFIFIDKNGKAFDYLEICFECDRIESKSHKIYFTTGCTQDLDLVKKYLISIGIKFGTTTTDASQFY